MWLVKRCFELACCVLVQVLVRTNDNEERSDDDFERERNGEHYDC
jgi:hypothetical protein